MKYSSKHSLFKLQTKVFRFKFSIGSSIVTVVDAVGVAVGAYKLSNVTLSV